MKDFQPPIASRTTNELIRIAHAVNHNWQEEAVQKAKQELRHRTVSIEEQKIKLQYFKDQEKAKEQIMMEARRGEDFPLIDKIFRIVFWPKYLLHDWFLKKEGYILMHKRRIQLLALGIFITSLFVVWSSLTHEEEDQNRVEEIDKVDVSEWEENRITD